MKYVHYPMLLFVLMAIHSTCAKAQLISPLTCPNLTGETRQLDYGDYHYRYNVYLYNEVDLETGHESFDTHFYHTSDHLHPIHNDSVNVKLANISDMLKNISDYTPGDDNIPKYSKTKHYSSIQFSYGIDNAHQLAIIFEPVYLVPDNSQQCRRISVGKYYWVGPDGWTSLNKTDRDIMIARYQSEIWIKHVDNDRNDFIESEDFNLADTKSSILPIQQILKMYCDNHPDSAPSLTDAIVFQVIANQYYVGSKNFKLHVVASYKFWDNDEDFNNFFGLAADFAQLCPINCDVIGINYYQGDYELTK